jgi:hypothetical protein
MPAAIAVTAKVIGLRMVNIVTLLRSLRKPPFGDVQHESRMNAAKTLPELRHPELRYPELR